MSFMFCDRKSVQLSYKLGEATHNKEVPGDQVWYQVSDLPSETQVQISISVVYEGAGGEQVSEALVAEGKIPVMNKIFRKGAMNLKVCRNIFS